MSFCATPIKILRVVTPGGKSGRVTLTEGGEQEIRWTAEPVLHGMHRIAGTAKDLLTE